MFNYERTLLRAFTEVMNNLAMIRNQQQQSDLRSEQVNTFIQSIETSTASFQSDRPDYMEVLMTRRGSFDADMDMIQAKNRQARAMIRAYRAPQGGWR